MEILPVNLDEFEVTQERPFGEMGIKHYKMPDAKEGTYRLFYKDGAHQDVVAHNASHAFQQAQREDLERIVNVKFAYSEMLDKNILQPTGEEVKPRIEMDDAKEAVVAEIQEEEYGTFEIMDIEGFAGYFSKKTE